jgi:hypothetical protein
MLNKYMLRKLYNCKNESGYIALLSVIIISVVLLVVTIQTGQTGWSTRFMVLGSEAKFQSKILAKGCGERALATFLADRQWMGGVTTTDVADGSCFVFPIQRNFPDQNEVTIRVQGSVRGSVTNIIFVFDATGVHQSLLPRPPASPVQLVVPPVLISKIEIPIMQ